MKKSKLDNKFRHHAWFKEGVTVRYALDNFAKTSDVYLSQKPSKHQSMRLFDPINYDDILTDGRYSYRPTEEEKEYYLERKAYWKEQKEIKYNEWLDTEIDVDKELRIHLGNNSHYDLRGSEYQLNIWRNYKVTEKTIKDYSIDEKERARLIESWENRIKMTKITRAIIDDLISKYKHEIKTNRDFENFKQIIDEELSEVVVWNTETVDWELIA